MEKTISFNEAYITCLTCDVCYDKDGLPLYCQKGWIVDPRDVLGNMGTAAKCDGWFPRVIGRGACGPEYSSGDRWYEKDSMS